MQMRSKSWRGAAILSLMAVTSLALGAAPADNPFAELEKGSLGTLPGFGKAAEPVTVEAHFQPGGDGKTGELTITAMIEKGYHIYSVTQPQGGPLATSIRLDPGSAYQLAGEFQATPAPEAHVDKEVWPGLTIEEHQTQVTWKAPVRIAAGTNPAEVPIRGVVQAQACEATSCIDLALEFSARYVPPATAA